MDIKIKHNIHVIMFAGLIIVLFMLLIFFSDLGLVGKAGSVFYLDEDQELPIQVEYTFDELIPGETLETPFYSGSTEFLVTMDVDQQGLFSNINLQEIECFPYEDDLGKDCIDELICDETYTCKEAPAPESEAVCGDGSLDSGEECDDGNLGAGDGCDAECKIEVEEESCGNGIIQDLEECDNGDLNNDLIADACRTNCKLAYCGDEVIDADEECDGTNDCNQNCEFTPDVPEVDCPLEGMTNYWNFDENEGVVLFDNINKLFGDVEGATWTNGLIEGALNFDGNDFVDFGAYIEEDTTYSIALWLKGNNGVALHRGLSNSCQYNPIISKTKVGETGCSAAGSLPITQQLDDEWHNLVVQRDENTLRVFVDGELDNSRTINPSGVNGRFQLGRIWSETNPTAYFTGLLDEVAIFDKVLSEDEVKELYNKANLNTAYCKLPTVGCGNGHVERYEECDDNNNFNGDGCNKDCKLECSGDPNMVSYWKAELNAQDYAGSNNGVLIEDVEFTDGILGQAFKFDSNKDWVEIANHETLQIDGDLTIEYWLKPENVGDARSNPFCKAYWGEFCFTIELENVDKEWPAGRLSTYHGMINPAGVKSYFGWSTSLPPGTIKNNEWQHIVITRDTIERKIRTYYNGEPSSVAGYPDIPEKSPSVSDLPVKIGQGYTGKVYKGLIDEVAIYNKVISQEEIKQHYEGILAGKSYCIASVPGCGDGFVEGMEECDDANAENEDGCNDMCKVEDCGDGIIQIGLGEECDDGNTEKGDGCNDVCKIEIPDYNCHDGLISYWDADENTEDQFGVNHCTGEVSFSDGHNKKAFDLQGGRTLDCGNDISLDFGEGDASISLWVKTTDVNGNILSKTSAGYGPGIKYSLANGWGGTSIAWFMDGTETSSNQYSYASEDINNGEWHFVVAVLNKEENKIRHYVDGHDVSTPVRDGPLGSISSQAKLLIGSSLFSGEVDEITLWNKALTQENIDELYLNGLQNCES